MIKTPGGKLRYLHIKKRGSPVRCGDCGIKLPGVSLLRRLGRDDVGGGVWLKGC